MSVILIITMTSSMVSPVSIYSKTLGYYADDLGEKTLRLSQFIDLCTVLGAEMSIQCDTLASEKHTPQKVYAQSVITGLSELNFDTIFDKCCTLYEHHNGVEYSKLFNCDLGWLSRRHKGEFDIAFDIPHKNLDEKLDECRPYTLIKALRLYVSDLYKKITGSYNPAAYDPRKVTYRVGDSRRTSDEFIRFCNELTNIHKHFCVYSEKLDEFFALFKKSGDLAKACKAELDAQRDAQRTAQRTEQQEKLNYRKGANASAHSAHSTKYSQHKTQQTPYKKTPYKKTPETPATTTATATATATSANVVPGQSYARTTKDLTTDADPVADQVADSVVDDVDVDANPDVQDMASEQPEQPEQPASEADAEFKLVVTKKKQVNTQHSSKGRRFVNK
jgi:hypothetical protein